MVAIVIIINVVIAGFSGEDLKWLAHVTARLQVSKYSQLSDDNFADQFIAKYIEDIIRWREHMNFMLKFMSLS